MNLSKKLWIVAASVPVLFGLGGCAEKLIGTHEGADKVMLMEASEVSKCKDIGKATVSVMSEVGFITRSPEKVEANLEQLARNTAADRGADAIVKGNSEKFGERHFHLYRCAP